MTTPTPAEVTEISAMNPPTVMLTFRSPKLGEVPYTASDVVRFAQGLPGFEGLHDFLVVTREECAPFVFLASLDDPEVTLPLLPWGVAAGAHAPVETGEAASAGPDPVPAIACYAVVAIAPQGREVVANLRAPVLVDLDNRSGRQVILADESLPLMAPVK